MRQAVKARPNGPRWVASPTTQPCSEMVPLASIHPPCVDSLSGYLSQQGRGLLPQFELREAASQLRSVWPGSPCSRLAASALEHPLLSVPGRHFRDVSGTRRRLILTPPIAIVVPTPTVSQSHPHKGAPTGEVPPTAMTNSDLVRPASRNRLELGKGRSDHPVGNASGAHHEEAEQASPESGAQGQPK